MKQPLTLYLAAPRGFCAGVDRAIQIVEEALSKSQLQAIRFDLEQLDAFVGNCLQLETEGGKRVLFASQAASDSLDDSQQVAVSSQGLLAPTSMGCLEEIGGGGARCCLLEVP